MSADAQVKEFLAAVKKFNEAANGPSGDDEYEAALDMRDTGLELVKLLSNRKAGKKKSQ